MKKVEKYLLIFLNCFLYGIYFSYAAKIIDTNDTVEMVLEESSEKISSKKCTVDFVAGIGLPEHLHTGLSIFFTDVYRFGLFIGFSPFLYNLNGKVEKSIVFSFDNYFLLKKAGTIDKSSW